MISIEVKILAKTTFKFLNKMKFENQPKFVLTWLLMPWISLNNNNKIYHNESSTVHTAKIQLLLESALHIYPEISLKVNCKP